MLNWLIPMCPVETGWKIWTESRMRWLTDKLGFDRLASIEVILPEHRYFPDPYAATPDDARKVFDRVCGYMKLDPNRFELDVIPEEELDDFVGEYIAGERPRIVVTTSQLPDMERLVATIAHELGHDILLGGGLITVDKEDHEPLTDLITVFLGLGLFMANATVRDKKTVGKNTSYHKIDAQGYLPSRICGYGLALFAYARGETKPDWARYLRPDAAQTFNAAIRYLNKTGDSLFNAETARQPERPPTEAEMIERLASRSPTVRGATLGDIAALTPPPATLLETVVRLLSDRDVDVQIEAARAIPSFGTAAHVAISDLMWCLSSDSETLRMYAAVALPTVGAPASQVVPELTRLLRDPDPWVLDAAADTLRRVGPAAVSAVPALVDAIRNAELNCVGSEAFADALVAIDPPAEVVENLLATIATDIRKLVRRSLRAARSRRTSDQSGAAPQERQERRGRLQ
jgi:hypothetical protein